MALESSVAFSTSAGSQEVERGGATQRKKAFCSVKGLFQNQGLEMANVTSDLCKGHSAKIRPAAPPSSKGG